MESAGSTEDTELTSKVVNRIEKLNKSEQNNASSSGQSEELLKIKNPSQGPSNDSKNYSKKYGWSTSTSPSWLQFMCNKNAFLIIFSFTCVLQGTFHTYFVAVITTLEKLFSIPSRTTGTLMAATEIGQVSSALLLPYFASSGHRPRWMGAGGVLFSLATLLCSSPHWLLPPNLKPITENTINYCIANSTIDGCSDMDDSSSAPGHYLLFGVLAMSLLSIGLGQTAVYTLGIPYLDDNVASRDSPLYFSITIGVRIMGPVLGFILGSLCTRLYIYPSIDPGFGPESPRWLGAWWLGMLIISVLLFSISLILSAFPRKLPDPDINRSTTMATAAPQPIVRSTLRNFPPTLRRLITNKLLLLRTASSVFHLLPISGLYTFLPKYLESQFRLPAHNANLITGTAGILVMGAGIFGSGIWIRIRGPSAKGVAGWVAATAGLYAAGMFLLMLIGCEAEGDFYAAGADLNTGNIEFRNSAWNFGNPACATPYCKTCSDFSPVCGVEDKQIYFSPCHAGCQDAIMSGPGNNTITQYQNCSCIPGSLATPGLCPSSCDSSKLHLYLALFMLIVLLHSTSEVGSMLLTLRCVQPGDKAMALGLIQCAIGLFGNVPCPILYGAIVDRACLLWGKQECSDANGNCWIYASSSFRQLFHGTTGGLMLIAFTIDLIFYFYAAEHISLDDSPPGVPQETTETSQELVQLNSSTANSPNQTDDVNS